MDGSKRNFFKKRANTQFKRKGDSNKRGKWSNSSREQFHGNSHPVDTVYRILCPSRKIGGVIGKAGSIIKALRDETQAKIMVADSIPGLDERVIIIFSPPAKNSRDQNSDEDAAAGKEHGLMEPHCAAQDALLRVHDRIVDDDIFGGMASDDDNGNTAVTARLLVANNMVGCLLGRGGDVIQRLRSETGASIRVLPVENLSAFAMNNDELVQISGKQDDVKKALYEVSTLLHQNPRKDGAPLNFSVPHRGQSFPPPGPLSPGNSVWVHRKSTPNNMPAMPWMEGHGSQPSGFGPVGFSDVPPRRGGDAPAEFSMKILCSAGKIGGVIGKGGFNVRQLQQETGTSIHVEDASTESDERVIRVSAFEALWNPQSQTIDAILQLQNKTSEFSEKGMIITRLLVPSSKVGCILGQGGNVINEMRRRTHADIRVYSKDDKPQCASVDEELVQISGNFGVAKDALAEIASRLRARTLRDANAGAEPLPVGPVHGFGPGRGLPGGGLSPSSAVGARPSRYEPYGDGSRREYEFQNYPVSPPPATGYGNMNSALEAKILNNTSAYMMSTGGNTISYGSEVSGARMKFEDPQSGRYEGIEFRRSSEHPTAAQNVFHGFMGSAGQNMNAQQSSYQNSNAQQSSYHSSMNAIAEHSPYQNMNTQRSPYRSMHLYQRQSPYQNMKPELNPYPLNAVQGPYPDMNPPETAYHHKYTAQQGAYPY